MATLQEALSRRNPPGSSTYSKGSEQPQERDAWEARLVRRVLGYIRTADIGEDVRRRHDRLGARIFYGMHWDRPMPSDRAAITANIAGAILSHKIAIMTRQDPIPVIEPDDVGDVRAAQLMAKVVRKVWRKGRLKEKIRRLATLANATRTAALKVLWDPVLKGGAGDIATDVIEGWNLVLDNTVGDPNQMLYCGNRASMNPSRAMLYYDDDEQYPGAAAKIRGLVERSATRKTGPLSGSGAPISTPWKMAYLPSPGASLVNGKPVVTAFAGELVQTMNEGTQLIELVEMYHRDYTRVVREVPVRDPLGQVKQEIVRDEEGMPQFEEAQAEEHQMPDGTTVRLPRFKISMQEQTEEKLVPKYPHWRRTTVAIMGQDGELIEDRAWDRRLPYAFYTDIEPLDGILGRGRLLQTEHLQALTNVGLSTITDTLRFGALCAWLAGTSSGVTTSVIIPGLGQVIPVNDVTALKPVETKPLDPQFFSLMDRSINLMERIMGATGIMQGEAAGRVDSAAGYDTLAEIGSATIVECTQRLETTISDWAEIVGEFAQEFYDERHAIAVEDQSGNITWERASSQLLMGALSYDVATGSTMAWSESARNARALMEYNAGLSDKQEYFEVTKKPNWRQVLARMVAVAGPQGAMGPAASPPPRMRATSSSSKPPKPKPHG